MRRSTETKTPHCSRCGETVPGVWYSLWDMEDRAERIYINSSNHPKLLKARELIREARELEKEVQDLRMEAAKKIYPKYKLEVQIKITEKSSWFSSLPEGTECLKYVLTLVNTEDYKKLLEEYGSVNTPDQTRGSVNYYRISNILFHDGGGHMILKDKQVCTDEEWQELKAGKLLEKFFHNPSRFI